MGILCCKPEPVDFDGPVDLYHFYLLRAVGKGAFGKVRVVQHKRTKDLYALKYINKAKCIKMRAVSNIIQERRLLEEIESPFVCNLRYAFQDDENMFMVLDLMLGGDLRFHLDRNGNMREEIVRFYMAELSLALDYLHSIQIVHRDLKPDNVLLDEKGHAHITDFNIAVHFSPRRALTSIAGSMAYMAPEVLAKRGYLSSVDWWSLGVMAYELLFGRRPFRGKTNSALTHSIMHDKCVFPENVNKMVSKEAVSFVSGLLERDIKKRLGCRNGIQDIKSHPFFAGMDWDAVEAKEAIPPFEPDSKKANFDATHELEELLLEDNPLKARKRKEDVDLNALSPELRLMEEHFLPFDHLKQRRRSYFKAPKSESGNEIGTISQISASTGIALADQPLAEMGPGGAHPSMPIGMSGLGGGPSSFSERSNNSGTLGRPDSKASGGGGPVGPSNGVHLINGHQQQGQYAGYMGVGPMGEAAPGLHPAEASGVGADGQEIMTDSPYRYQHHEYEQQQHE